MTDAPERIWAHEPTTFDGMDVWQTTPAEHTTEYIRADLADDLVRAGYLAGLEAAANQCASMANEMDWCDEDGDSPLYLANDCCDAVRAIAAAKETPHE